MPTPRDSEILLRVGQSALLRTGRIWAPRSVRDAEVDRPTFARADASTCAPYLGRDGKLYTAAAGKLRFDYTPYWADGLTRPDGSPKAGLAFNRSRVNLVTWSDALSNWTSIGTPVVTDAFATLGDLGLTLIEDNDAGVTEYKESPNVVFTGDGVKGCLVYISAPLTPTDTNLSVVKLRDQTALADRINFRPDFNADGTLVTPVSVSAGTLITVKRLGTGSHGFPVYALYFQSSAVTAANQHRWEAAPAEAPGSNLGKLLIGGFMAVNGLYPPLHRVKTTGSTVTVAADSLIFPNNHGAIDQTWLASLYRPIWADVSGDISAPVAPYIAAMFNTPVPRIALRGAATVRQFVGMVDTAGTDSNATPSIPAGAELIAAARFQSLATAGVVSVDVGSGYVVGSAATGFAALGAQSIKVGGGGTDEELDGLLFDFLVINGSGFTRNEAIAVL